KQGYEGWRAEVQILRFEALDSVGASVHLFVDEDGLRDADLPPPALDLFVRFDTGGNEDVRPDPFDRDFPAPAPKHQVSAGEPAGDVHAVEILDGCPREDLACLERPEDGKETEQRGKEYVVQAAHVDRQQTPPAGVDEPEALCREIRPDPEIRESHPAAPGEIDA